MDDSKDEKHACFSALIFPAESWNAAIDQLVGVRRQMNQSDGAYIAKELHSTDWVGGRGKISADFIPIGARIRLFKFFITGVSMIPGMKIMNGIASKNREEKLLEFMLNRIQTNMASCRSQALMFSDEGKNYDKMLRRLRRFNYIPSRFGPSRNVPITNIVEDIVYKDSAKSLLIQSADACAFSLLRYKFPTPKLEKHNFSETFGLLDHVLIKQANRYDKDGIVYA